MARRTSIQMSWPSVTSSVPQRGSHPCRQRRSVLLCGLGLREIPSQWPPRAAKPRLSKYRSQRSFLRGRGARPRPSGPCRSRCAHGPDPFTSPSWSQQLPASHIGCRCLCLCNPSLRFSAHTSTSRLPNLRVAFGASAHLFHPKPGRRHPSLLGLSGLVPQLQPKGTGKAPV